MEPNVLTSVLDAFTAIGDWFVGFVPNMFELFWTTGANPGDPGQLTFLGVLACAGLGLSVIFLVLGVISNFLHFRGVSAAVVRRPKIIDRFFGFVASSFNLAA